MVAPIRQLVTHDAIAHPTNEQSLDTIISRFRREYSRENLEIEQNAALDHSAILPKMRAYYDAYKKTLVTEFLFNAVKEISSFLSTITEEKVFSFFITAEGKISWCVADGGDATFIIKGNRNSVSFIQKPTTAHFWDSELVNFISRLYPGKISRKNFLMTGEELVKSEYRQMVGFSVPRSNSPGGEVSRIKIYENRYLASGSHVSGTSFWNAVFQENAGVIVKLNATFHDTVYEMKDTGRGFTVNLIEEKDISPDIILQQFSVSNLNNGRTVIVSALNYLKWPDFSVPDKASLQMLINAVNELATDALRPIYVQCGAGIGRTGTFISLHSRLSQLKLGQDASLFHIVMEARRQRNMPMVETESQYLYAYQF